VIRRLWTEEEPFDFHGTHVRLTGALQNPKPVQRPHPPIMIGGRASGTLRVVAEHADLWNIPGGGDIDDLAARSALLDRFCADIGRDPAAITRSIHLPVSYDRPEDTRGKIREAVEAGFTHVILGLSAPYPAGIARWIADELIIPSVSISTTTSTSPASPGR
jgi:alkanesulfonate monooxygenase SsuD/methylene tetrahydromethanopterin reductase-like flavin-dependent oxidoreductase (luciferase family)